MVILGDWARPEDHAWQVTHDWSIFIRIKQIFSELKKNLLNINHNNFITYLNQSEENMLYCCSVSTNNWNQHSIIITFQGCEILVLLCFKADTGECIPLELRTHLCYPDTVEFDSNFDTFSLNSPYFVLSSSQFEIPMREKMKIITTIVYLPLIS